MVARRSYHLRRNQPRLGYIVLTDAIGVEFSVTAPSDCGEIGYHEVLLKPSSRIVLGQSDQDQE